MNNNEKKTIRLEAIDPVEIYGAANKVLEALCSYFPNLKVVARGNEIMLEGKETIIHGDMEDAHVAKEIIQESIDRYKETF